MINLLPESYLKEEKSKKLKIYLGLALAVQLGVSGAVGSYPLIKMNEKKEQLTLVNHKLEDKRFEEVRTVQERLKQERTNYENWSRYLKEMKTTSFIGGDKLDTLLGNIPVGVAIDVLEMNEVEKSIIIKGKTKNTFSVMGYVSKLQSIYQEAEVLFHLGDLQEEGKYSTFELSMKWQEMEEKRDE